jgi:hypothetical protein
MHWSNLGQEPICGVVLINAFAMSYSRVVGKPEVIIGPDMFGGQDVNAFYIASVYRKLTRHQTSLGNNAAY